jgi:hypothetical protein
MWSAQERTAFCSKDLRVCRKRRLATLLQLLVFWFDRRFDADIVLKRLGHGAKLSPAIKLEVLTIG